MAQGLVWLFIVLVASGVGLVMTGVWMLNYPPGFILTGLALIAVGVPALLSLAQRGS